MNSTEIQFTIQCLDGDTFRISIARTDAKKFFCGETNLYNKYGLDVLKDAISVYNGTDPVIQQLICEDQDSALTISDSLIPLENKVITLMIKPSFLIEFSLHRPCDDYHPTLPRVNKSLTYHLVANTKYLAENASEPIICYLESEHLSRIEAVGQYRDFFKIKTKNIPHDAIRYWYSQNLNAFSTVWLRYDNRSMKIVIN
jgi:hypothetical protein